MKKEKTIYKHAEEIEVTRKEEKERIYGDFEESIGKAARIASEMTNKEITTEDFYKCMIALKLSRLAYSHKYDTFLDGIVYLGSLERFTNKEKEDGK